MLCPGVPKPCMPNSPKHSKLLWFKGAPRSSIRCFAAVSNPLPCSPWHFGFYCAFWVVQQPQRLKSIPWFSIQSSTGAVWSAEGLRWSQQPLLSPAPCICADAEDGGRQAPNRASSKSPTGQQSTESPAKSVVGKGHSSSSPVPHSAFKQVFYLLEE